LADKQTVVYVNVRKQICSVAPVFPLDRLESVVVSATGSFVR